MNKAVYVDNNVQKYVDENSLRLNKFQLKLIQHSMNLPSIINYI